MDDYHYIDYVYDNYFILSYYYIFLKDTLREGEVDEAEHSLSDIVNLIQTRPINNISILDLSASLENYEEVIIYNHTGQRIMKSSNESTIQFIPNNNLQRPSSSNAK